MFLLLSIIESLVIYMPFLYFPEDKSEYIPAAISMLIFGIACVLTFLWIKKVSKKQEFENEGNGRAD